MFNQIFYTDSVANYIFKIANKEVCTNSIDSIDNVNNTLVITTKEDYIKVHSLFPSGNIRVLNKETLYSLCFSNNTKIIPKHLYAKNRAMMITYYENVIEDSNESIDNKYFYTVSESVLNLNKALKLSKGNSKFIHKDRLLIAMTGIQPKGSLSKKEFERKYKAFCSSEFVNKGTSLGCALKTKEQLIFNNTNHNIFTNHVLGRDYKFNVSNFTKSCIDFVYGKPLEVLKNTHEVKTLSLANVGNKLGMTASNVRQHTKGMKKLYKHEVISEAEYINYTNTPKKERTSFCFAVYTNQNKIDRSTGEIKKVVHYFKSLGTKLLTNTKYKSYVKTTDGKIKLSSVVKTRESLLSIPSKEKYVYTIKNNNMSEFFNKLSEFKESERCSVDSTESSDIGNITSIKTTDVEDDMKLIVQFVGRDYKTIKEKLLLLCTLTEINGQAQVAKKIENRKFIFSSIGKMKQAISYKVFGNDFSHIGELEYTSSENEISKSNYRVMINIINTIDKKVQEYKLDKSTIDNKSSKYFLNKIDRIEKSISKNTKDVIITFKDNLEDLKDVLNKDINLKFFNIIK